MGTFRGIRTGRTSTAGPSLAPRGILPIGGYGGYEPLVVEIVKFFKTGKPPVSADETIEIFAFMEAADESKRQGGKPVTIESVMSKAQESECDSQALPFTARRPQPAGSLPLDEQICPRRPTA